MREGHISKAFDGSLAALHIGVVEMGGLVLDQVHEAARAYTDWDSQPAELVLAREPAVNDYEKRLGVDQLTLLARRQPVAGDLRAIVSMSKVAAELERAGDEAKKIARAVIRHEPQPAAGTTRDVRHLGQLAVNLMRSALESFDRLDPLVAAEVIARDEELDEEYASGLRRLMSRTMEDGRTVGVALEAAFVLKSLERVGDHARNIARQVLLIQGADPETGAGAESAAAPAAGSADSRSAE
ncbi:MAG: phosphate signaling complex protein PhoU [Sinobacteraceae bacterium]|nr:phosphate signaling complex protein PhoU [Nevskiaceae bacterium]